LATSVLIGRALAQSYSELVHLSRRLVIGNHRQHLQGARRKPPQPLPPRIIESSTDAYSVVDGELWVPCYGQKFLSAAIAAVDFWQHWQD
jgi:hypothetical protein